MDSIGKVAKGPSDGRTKDESSGNVIGPVLPPGFLSSKLSSESESSSDSEAHSEHSDESAAMPAAVADSVPCPYGPPLPPGFPKKPAEKPVIGAALPPGMTKDSLGIHGNEDEDSGESHELIGPLPPTSSQHSSKGAYEDFERRASKMKHKLTCGPDEELRREEWMTVLPPELGKNFGLGPRSFLRKTPRPTGDRSVWTETPSQRIEKELSGDVGNAEEQHPGPASSRDELQDVIQQNYDEKMSKKAEELNKAGKRAKSLMEIHQRNLKRKKKEDRCKPKERKPFDRDVDLKVNQIDDAKRKALVKQSAQLNDKFSRGKGQFL